MFASNIANKAEVCAETSKKKMRHTYCTNAHGLKHVDSVACPFCRVVGELPFTFAVVNLTASISYAKVLCCAVAIHH